jgi:ABC-2 type transport system ATP-binding protein
MLAGLLSPTKDPISYNGEKDYRKLIGFMPQHPSFFNWITPMEFLYFVGKLSAVHGYIQIYEMESCYTPK